MTYIQVALLLLKIVNFIIRRVEQSKWEASGYQKAVADELKGIEASVGIATQSLKDAKAMTDEERRKSLKEPL